MINDVSKMNVKYGINYYGDCSEDALSSLGYLKNDIADLKSRYITLGFHLDEFARNKYYLDFGYENLNEFCLENLDLDKTAVSRVLGVWSRFAEMNGTVRTMFIDEHYQSFSYTQLTEMLPIPDKDLKKITPDMTCKEIREFKKKLKDVNKKEFDDNVPFSNRIENGELLSELVSTLEKFFHKHYKVLSAPTLTSKQIIFNVDGESYKIMLMCPQKKEK